MASSYIETTDWQSNDINQSYDYTSSIHSGSIQPEALSGPLAAPHGWRSQIIQSNSPVPIDTSSEFYSNNTAISNYNDQYETDAYNTYYTNHVPATLAHSKNQYRSRSYDDASIYQQQIMLSNQDQHNIIRNVERQYPPPVVINRTLPNNHITYKQNIAVRYLKPPTPPPPGPLIIREVRPPPPPPQPPIRIQQRAPAPPTPPPIILREKPPALPPHVPPKVIERVLPAPPAPPRRVIVERYPAYPPKPPNIVIERWLPYKQTQERRVIVERAKPPCLPPAEPNLLILHDAPRARIHKEYINEGVIRADPCSYYNRYGSDLDISRYSHLVEDATRAVPPPLRELNDHYRSDNYVSYWDDYYHSYYPDASSSWGRSRRSYSIPRSSSYDYYDYYDYDSPYRHYYDDYYYPRRGHYLTNQDVTSSWGRYCGLSPYDYCSSSYDYYPSSSYSYSSYYDGYPSSYYSRSSSYPIDTIRVNSEGEFQDVLSRLTHGRMASTGYPY